MDENCARHTAASQEEQVATVELPAKDAVHPMPTQQLQLQQVFPEHVAGGAVVVDINGGAVVVLVVAVVVVVVVASLVHIWMFGLVCACAFEMRLHELAGLVHVSRNANCEPAAAGVVSATLGSTHVPVVMEHGTVVPGPVAATKPVLSVDEDGIRPAVMVKSSPTVVRVVVIEAATEPLTAGPKGVPDCK